jgi:hypothetical protein
MISRLALVYLFVQLSVICVHATIPKGISDSDSVIRASLTQLASKYNIRIHIYLHGDTSLRSEKNIKSDSVARGGYSFKTISPYQSILIERFTNVLLTEFNKYPVDFILSSGLKEIAFVANLRVGRQRRIAMPESDTRTLYFDVNYPGARDEYCSHAIHHELFHLVYFEIHSSFYYKDPEWLALNYPTFRYKGGGGLAYGNYQVFKKQKPASGFITPYATYGLEEDMAEVFAFLMTRDGFPIISYWTQVDDILSNKAQYILRLMSSRSPEFNMKYLKRIHASD